MHTSTGAKVVSTSQVAAEPNSSGGTIAKRSLGTKGQRESRKIYWMSFVSCPSIPPLHTGQATTTLPTTLSNAPAATANIVLRVTAR